MLNSEKKINKYLTFLSSLYLEFGILNTKLITFIFKDTLAYNLFLAGVDNLLQSSFGIWNRYRKFGFHPNILDYI